jgi:hypothetical protein
MRFMMHQSIATIDSPEFINLQPLEINPLMSSCEIKVMYLGENRNHSYITKDVATEMAKTLRGAPIVGYYREEKQDFADHGEKIIFDDEGIKFECMTKPYGFVAPDAKVWFQKFEDTDEFGNKTTREYLMTTGYLWTGQYEECKSVIEQGKPQSMELDEENLNGHWSTNTNTGMDFFIINDAIFSKLCILGDDVEPCFEGSSITAQEVSTSFTKIDESFKKTLYTMMQDLKFALEGGQNMELEETVVTTENESIVEVVEEKEISEEMVNEEQTVLAESEDSIEAETNENFTASESTEEVKTTFEDGSDSSDSEESSETDSTEDTTSENSEDSEEDSTDSNEEENAPIALASEEPTVAGEDEETEEEVQEIIENTSDKNDTKKVFELEEELSNLKAAYSDLDSKYQALVEFKQEVENEKKDALIKSFYMLSDEDKAEVIENKANYSLEEIESKLSVICVRKKVNFDKEEDNKQVEEEKVMTYTLDGDMASTLPAWLSMAKQIRDSKK